jgi:hypothetical protein
MTMREKAEFLVLFTFALCGMVGTVALSFATGNDPMVLLATLAN